MPIQIPLVTTNRDELQKKIANASTTLYQVAKAAYGPGAGNVMLGFKHGAPMLSRDGVTNLKQVRLDDPFEDDVVQAIIQASEKNNSKVGDGTTAVAVFAHHLLMSAQRMVGLGINPMEVSRKLKQAEITALEYIESVKKPTGEEIKLEDIATVAAGDPDIGAMIADIMTDIGVEGGVLIEDYEGLGKRYEIIDGFYFPRGYTDTFLINDQAANQSLHKDVPVFVSNKVFNTRVDIGSVLEGIRKASFKEVIFIAEVKNEALETLKLNKANGIILAVPIDPPFVAGGQTLFLDDIATMVGSEVYTGIGFDAGKHLGLAQEVLVTEHATSILGGDGDQEVIQERIESLREQLKDEEHPQSQQFIRDRLARLTGKMAILKVGGAIEFERDEVKERVRDAVCAVQSAMKDGVVPGGGATLARIKGTEFDDAFKQPFRQLVDNMGLNPDEYLAKLKDGSPWTGFNLRDISDKPVDMLKAGVLDASLVVREIVINAVAVVSGLITASAAVSYREKE